MSISLQWLTTQWTTINTIYVNVYLHYKICLNYIKNQTTIIINLQQLEIQSNSKQTIYVSTCVEMNNTVNISVNF